MDDRILILLIGWISSKIIWALTDPNSLKKRLQHLIFSYKTGAVLVLVIGLQIALYYQLPYLRAHNRFLIYLGFITFAIGYFLAIWAKLVMKSNWSVPGQHDIQKQTNLVTSGPFKFSRNPIYLGIVLMGFGGGLMTVLYSWAFSFLFWWHFNTEIKKEEKLLTKYFGKKYTNYKKQVRRWI